MPRVRSQVVIESRHLDTDEREHVRVEAEPPPEEHGQQRLLARLVTERHPGARFRSFADGAATFLDQDHLIVAAYSPRPAKRRPRGEGDAARQDPLFAA